MPTAAARCAVRFVLVVFAAECPAARDFHTAQQHAGVREVCLYCYTSERRTS
jgi:hypothetical protein